MKTNATFRAALGAMLYGAAALSATPAAAEITLAEREALMEARTGDMKKLVIHKEARPKLERAFQAKNGGAVTMDRFAGKVTVVNFWATWCPPCRKEMLMLSELQTEFGGDAFEVVTIATGRNDINGIKRFLGEIGVDNLPLYLDPKQGLARDMAVLGLPITLILDPEGREIARMRGDAEWNSESAKAIISALIADAGEG